MMKIAVEPQISNYDDGCDYGITIVVDDHPAHHDDDQTYSVQINGSLTQPDNIPGTRYSGLRRHETEVHGTAQTVIRSLETAAQEDRLSFTLGEDVWFCAKTVTVRGAAQEPLRGLIEGGAIVWGLGTDSVTSKIKALKHEAAHEGSWDNFSTAERLNHQAQRLEILNSYADTPLHRAAMERSANDREQAVIDASLAQSQTPASGPLSRLSPEATATPGLS